MRVSNRKLLLLAALAAATGSGHALAAKYQRLYSFCASTSCTDGAFPNAGLAMDSSKAANLYGVANGGANQSGIIFELVHSKSSYSYKPLYSLAACGATCPDGQSLGSPLIVDKDGNLYGTASGGGANSGGTVFELSPNKAGTKWTFKVLYSFCIDTECFDGQSPSSGLTYAGAASGTPYDGTSTLYGATSAGGLNDGGTVYQLAHKGKTWSELPIYSFCETTNCPDGLGPQGDLAVDATGLVYGTTLDGGANGGGALFEVDPSPGTEVVLHSFCGGSSCKDGTEPQSGVTLSAQTLLGNTSAGGNKGQGIAYSFDLQAKKETILYAFCKRKNCVDGEEPTAPFSGDPSHFNGVAQGGGFGDGLLFRFKGTAETVLHNFCAEANCADGSNPQGRVLTDSAGNLIGVTQSGGDQFSGTIYEVTP